MTDEEFYTILRQSTFITREDWALILQSEDPNSLHDDSSLENKLAEKKQPRA